MDNSELDEIREFLRNQAAAGRRITHYETTQDGGFRLWWFDTENTGSYGWKFAEMNRYGQLGEWQVWWLGYPPLTALPT